MATPNEAFFIEEYKALRDEIRFHQRSVQSLQAGTLAALWLVFAFIAKEGKNDVASVMPFLVLAAAFGSLAHYRRLTQIGRYMAKAERRWTPAGGWEVHLENDVDASKGHDLLLNSPFVSATVFAWLAMLIGSLWIMGKV